MKGTVEITGIDDVNHLLSKIGPRTAYNLMRSTIHAVASDIAKGAKADSPVDDGDLKKAIKSKRERVINGYLRSTVRVNPVAFYWRFLEYGQGPDGIEHAMFLRAVEKFRRESTGIFLKQFGKKWEAAMRRASKRAG